MDIDLELQEKEVFREIVWEGNFDQIAIWLDGEWSVFASVHYEQKTKDEEPVYVLQQQQAMDAYSSDETLDFLIQEIEDMLNARMRNNMIEQE